MPRLSVLIWVRIRWDKVHMLFWSIHLLTIHDQVRYLWATVQYVTMSLEFCGHWRKEDNSKKWQWMDIDWNKNSMFIVSVSFMQIVMRSSGFFCDSHVRATENMTVRKSQGHIQSSNHILQNIKLSFIHTRTFFHNCNRLIHEQRFSQKLFQKNRWSFSCSV